jgi:hypothetical protein
MTTHFQSIGHHFKKKGLKTTQTETTVCSMYSFEQYVSFEIQYLFLLFSSFVIIAIF